MTITTMPIRDAGLAPHDRAVRDKGAGGILPLNAMDPDDLAALIAPLTAGQKTKAGSQSVVLPSDPDARTAAADISVVDTGTSPLAGQGGITLVTGNPTASSFQTWPLNGHSSAAITVTGTFTATMNIEVSADAGLTYAPASAKLRGKSLDSSTITGPGVFQVDVTGMTHIRTRCTAYTSGTPHLALTASSSPGLTQVLNPLRLVDSGGNQATVKAASTAATGTDTALVVALRDAPPRPGSTGLDFSANSPAYPNVGAPFAGTGPYASYVLVATVRANASRKYIEIANLTGDQIAVVRDDGTAASSAPPNNATMFALSGAGNPGSQGAGWSSETFFGRLQIYAPATLSGNSYVAVMEN